MKQFDLKTLVTVCIFAVLAFACTDQEADSSVSETKYVPVRIESKGKSGILQVDYGYDNINRLIKIEKQEVMNDGGWIQSILLEIFYDEQGQISELCRKFSEKKSGQEDEQVTRDTIRYYYYGMNVAVNDPLKNAMIEFDKEGRICSYRYDSENEKAEFFSKNYKYSGDGNIIAMDLNNQYGEVIAQHSFTYDENKSIFCDVNIPQWFLVSQLQEVMNVSNNCLRHSIMSPEGHTSVSVIQYEYDRNGYPVRESVYREGYSLAVDVEPAEIIYKAVKFK